MMQMWSRLQIQRLASKSTQEPKCKRPSYIITQCSKGCSGCSGPLNNRVEAKIWKKSSSHIIIEVAYPHKY